MNRSLIFRPAWLRGLCGRVVLLPLVVLFLLGPTTNARVDPVVRTIVVGTAPVAVDMDRTTGRALSPSGSHGRSNATRFTRILYLLHSAYRDRSEIPCVRGTA